MRQTTLDTLDRPALVGAFNLVYEQYVVPAVASEEWMERHIESNDIWLSRSPLWLDDDGAVVGLALLGARELRGWVGGFGIAPGWRGRGLSHRLIEDVVATARDAGLRTLQLEVITTNTAAARTYERAGFKPTRDLLVLTRPAGARPVGSDPTAARLVDPRVALAARERIPAAPPVWQREPRCFRETFGMEALLVGSVDAPQATALYSTHGDFVRLHDLAALDALSARALLAALVDSQPRRFISLINEPEGSEALPALNDGGWVEQLRQNEMVLELR
jgi:GNAT superfamily N-acetyltransferase